MEGSSFTLGAGLLARSQLGKGGGKSIYGKGL